MSLNLKVIQISEIDEIIAFEKHLLAQKVSDEMEREIESWNARWRRESLEHYLPKGWSFLVRDRQGTLRGYFIGQALLFFDGQTQSLWIDHLQAPSDESRQMLVDLAGRLAREKNFQRAYLPFHPELLTTTAPYPIQAWNAQTLFMKTTKA